MSSSTSAAGSLATATAAPPTCLSRTPLRRCRHRALGRRLWVIDFGYTHAFVWQAWAQDPQTKTLYRYAELYRTQLLVEDAAATIKGWMSSHGEGFPSAIICDHDAEDRATLQRHLGIPTIAARKEVSPGIQAVKARLLSQAGEKRAGLVLLRAVGLGRDPALVDAKLPTCTEEEIESYVWRDGVKDSEPLKANDHGCDAMRYLVMYLEPGEGCFGWDENDFLYYGSDGRLGHPR